MNTQKNQEIAQSLAELSAIVDSFHPEYDHFNGAVLLALNIIAVVIIIELGLLWGLLLLCVGILPILYKTLTAHDNSPSKKELAERACILMSHCINWHKYPEDDVRRMILDYEIYSANLPLYREFVSIFPHMASKKLEKLASIIIKE